MSPPDSVLSRYAPALDGLHWAPVGGGFSGATVWRGSAPGGNPLFALKAWPAGTPPERLVRVHGWLKQVAHLPFVPHVLLTTDGKTFATDGGRVWDATIWMPGEPVANPSVAEVQAACAAVARLHACWPVVRQAVCPGVRNRLRALADFRTHFANERFLPPVSPALYPLLRRARSVVATALPAALAALRAWEAVALPLRPCVRDLRGEHVLFVSGQVGGVVDYGATEVDYPAVDLARLLGDFAGGDGERFAAGLTAYRVAGGELDAPDELVRVLDRTGVVGSVVGWLMRVVVNGQTPRDEGAVAARLGGLVGRVERIAGW